MVELSLLVSLWHPLSVQSKHLVIYPTHVPWAFVLEVVSVSGPSHTWQTDEERQCHLFLKCQWRYLFWVPETRNEVVPGHLVTAKDDETPRVGVRIEISVPKLTQERFPTSDEETLIPTCKPCLHLRNEYQRYNMELPLFS